MRTKRKKNERGKFTLSSIYNNLISTFILQQLYIYIDLINKSSYLTLKSFLRQGKKEGKKEEKETKRKRWIFTAITSIERVYSLLTFCLSRKFSKSWNLSLLAARRKFSPPWRRYFFPWNGSVREFTHLDVIFSCVSPVKSLKSRMAARILRFFELITPHGRQCDRENGHWKPLVAVRFKLLSSSERDLIRTLFD